MPYTGILTQSATCAICKKAMPEGELVYFDPTKRQGSHLAHSGCWDELRKSRGIDSLKPKKGLPAVSSEHLAPPF